MRALLLFLVPFALSALLVARDAAAWPKNPLEKVKETAEEALQDTGLDEALERVRSYLVAFEDVSTEQEIEIGRGMAATVAGHYGLARDEALTDYVGLVGATVAAQAGTPGIVYRFGVLDSDAVNALSTPGGYVFVTRGALERMEDEAMLAGVLAHEVAHVHERHVVEEIQREARKGLGLSEGTRALGMDEDDVFYEVVTVGTDRLFLGLSREDELEADTEGTELAAAAGYDPTGLRRFLVALDARPGEVHWLLGNEEHPERAERLEAIDAILEALPPNAAVVAAERFAARGGAEASGS